MARIEDSPWAIPVAQIASRAGQSKQIDADFPAPAGIGDEISGIKEGTDVHVRGSFDSIVDGLIFTGRLTAPFISECTRCLKPIDEDWPVDVTVFFPYESETKDAAQARNGKNAKNTRNDKDEDVDIIAGEDESEDTYPLLANGAWADIEALIRDAFVEALPLQPLCRPDCAGLCPQCGEDLNEHPDHHCDEPGDLRFAGLAGLKAQLEAEQGK
ncbi:YceD family protein [Bifidobacterium oedipodis]|uniref:DNA-binding protein n=1 Tax=Bifidobacterium oedipodis TaxID=2675322 RepID=A0A7Y0HUH0_9BIFI|nr:DUF177 domain-containing protein [Bifidobacterium sp. DSM 109957]NMM95177.1 DNA-binding protein [Bifidobacterium sp. DSM 109957]